MIKYADDYNPIFEYNDKIQSGEIIACQKIKKVYQHIVENINNPNFEFYYNSKKANKAIEFIENYCKHSKGKWGGKPIILELWQKAAIAATFGMVHKIEETRQYRVVFLKVARKNGKSLIGSAIGLECLVVDNEMGAEVFSVATKRDQAKIVWSEAQRMILSSPSLKKRLKCLTGDIVYKKTFSSFKPLSSESNTQDGLNVHCAIIDELHAWKDQNLYNVVEDGTSSREQPLIFIISTDGTERENVFDLKSDEAQRIINGYSDPDGYKDESFLPIFYELDKKSEWTDESCWIKANPNLGVSKNIDILRKKVVRAQELSGLVKNLLCKDFNIPETDSQAWLSYDDILNKETFNISELKTKYCIGGTDLSRTTDLTSASILFEIPNDDNIYYESMYWLPEELLLKRVKEDKIPYDLWHDQGLIRLCKGNKINPHNVTEWFEELNDKGLYLYSHGYDRYSAEMWIKEMDDIFGKINIQVAQGKKTLSDPMRMMEADFKSKVIIYNNNPITKWCLSNVAVSIDINDNIQPCKTSNQRKRIDGFAGMLNAYVVWNNDKADYRSFIGKK